MDPYASCTCGSGKKFKWCCQPIQDEIGQVFGLLEQGQAEAASRMMDGIAERHPDNPQVWGQKAQLQYAIGQHEEAEKTLDKAFELFPTYPFGYFLKASFRMNEGELPGALLLLRKAAEAYDPNAHDLLAQIHVDIFNCEMKINHPIAARAALEMALRFHPTNEDLRKGMEQIFEGGQNPNLPVSASRAYRFKAPANATPEQKHAWENTLKTPGAAKLAQAAQRFEQLTQADESDVSAWYNLALCQAWLGQNAKAVAALERYVQLESDETQAAHAWALAEILRLGQGMEAEADVAVHSIAFGLNDPKAFVAELGELERAGRLTGARVDEEQGVLSAVILETPPPSITPELQAKQSLRLAAYLILMGNVARIWNTNPESVQAVFQQLQQKLGNVIAQPHTQREPAKFSDVLTEAIRIPRNVTSQEEMQARVREGFEKHFEEEWIHRPLKSLSNISPVDAAGHANLRKKLRGVVQFIRECAEMTNHPYDFSRLERKLGLLDAAPAATPADGSKPDISSLGAAELAGLDVNTLSTADLDVAYQTAIKLDARELAGKFASILVEKPAYPERPDRFPLYQLLIQQAIGEGKLDDALEYVNDGERDDCEHNEGKRRNDYELRRAQLHAKRGEFDDSERVYDGLISRAPTQLEYRVNAAETMLSARQGPKALKYAKEGAAAAVKAQNRDLEGHFKELMDAAQRK
jgi:tetratricopeptide (TPR) repeat protein